MTMMQQVADLHPDGFSNVADAVDPHDWRDNKVREWLLLLLRFAITRDSKDQILAFAMADEIDALGMQWRPSAPSFFLRSSQAVCAAIVETDSPGRITVLKAHIHRIEDARLQQAFVAAIGLEQEAPGCPNGRTRKRSDLWRGLRGS